MTGLHYLQVLIHCRPAWLIEKLCLWSLDHSPKFIQSPTLTLPFALLWSPPAPVELILLGRWLPHAALCSPAAHLPTSLSLALIA